ncbi:MAG TPA: bifunctional diaminohydroxyphosphoribosylaminopyrimidine deaminase/5-amino-6-(5-phosphoribosylamino)uracil reductase RibD [Deltaproteobacteria bacterium]|nr:bifunctional diaminohydroxyphosphoribosylaminopyrimidine deaminase/5-amino-6-(5-phosphoribosylamino)uracil reductase RibD [Deltaproteobacteria bacterium]
MADARDAEFMREAVHLAGQALGRTAPNPSVGAVVVKDGRVVGRGFHPKAGMPHAEIYALKEAGERARGATVYVTLEPCNHYGRTPPCTEALIKAGVKRVVVGSLDPNPLVSGAGIRRLAEAGVEVETGVLKDECGGIILWYRTWVEKKRPYVIMKAAITLDGRIAASSGDSRWISSEESRAYVHELRNRVDAVLVGHKTVAADDPMLTCRMPGGRDPLRIILDARLVSKPEARCLGKGSVIFTAAPEGSWAAHLSRGTELVPVSRDDTGRLPWGEVLGKTAEMGVHAVMVEGGSGVFSSLLASGNVDSLLLFIAPRVLGGGVPLVDWGRTERVANAMGFVITRLDRIGSDILVECTPGG